MCPYCQNPEKLVKIGFYQRKSDGKKLQRFRCTSCRKSVTEKYWSIDYRLRKRYLNQRLFRMLCRGLSQRACAYLLGIHHDTVARRIPLFGRCAALSLEGYRKTRPKVHTWLIDEMESFEHTKCKPLTMPIAVEEKTRKILSLRVGRIAAKGHLAKISRKKYGPRPCERAACLKAVMQELSACSLKSVCIKSDESQHYPQPIKSFFPQARHQSYKGRRACVVGQGELKRGGFDPLFSLNHTYAMIRDNLKRLSRRTWATTKRPDRLQDLLFLYAYFHNERLDRPKGRISLLWPIPS
ncbi:MAG: hypothetical protein ACOH5I_01740 [Oligoflexus sp.]